MALLGFLKSLVGPAPQTPTPPIIREPSEDDHAETATNDVAQKGGRVHGSANGEIRKDAPSPKRQSASSRANQDRAAMPPPPVVQREAGAPGLGRPRSDSASEADEEQTTPKASAVTTADDNAVPSFSLSVPAAASTANSPRQPPGGAPAAPPAFGLMAPPPRPAPPSLRPTPGASALSRSTLPIPNRGGGGGLAPPPTHTSKPAKPAREVVLAPGHSPLDWARISTGPGADLRGLPPNSPYLRVTPSMLKKMTGRKGKDAWTVLSGKVYNITPYIPFHPGGEPELLRCAGRDGTKLFGEIHPWVNYEGMLAACLVGIAVSEDDAGGMDEMD